MRTPLLVGLMFLAASCSDSSPGVPDALPAIDAAPDAPLGPLPDLVLVGDRIAASVYSDVQDFPPGDCALVETCVDAPGTRKLLRFDTTTWNRGDAHLSLGRPQDHLDIFEWSSCHMHFHFTSYARYDLLDANNNLVVTGHKQAFCLMDTDQVNLASPGPNFDCSFQGISSGWADTYGAYLDCQWIDVTDVAPGNYMLRITLNTERILPESDYTNNVFETPVTIPPQ